MKVVKILHVASGLYLGSRETISDGEVAIISAVPEAETETGNKDAFKWYYSNNYSSDGHQGFQNVFNKGVIYVDENLTGGYAKAVLLNTGETYENENCIMSVGSSGNDTFNLEFVNKNYLSVKETGFLMAIFVSKDQVVANYLDFKLIDA